MMGLPNEYRNSNLLVRFEQLIRQGPLANFVRLEFQNSSQAPRLSDEKGEAFLAIYNFLLELTDQGNKLSEEAIPFFAFAMIQRAADYWGSIGVNFDITYYPRANHMELVLSLQGDHPLNRLAREMAQVHNGRKLSYDPEMLIRTGFSAIMDSNGVSIFLAHHNIFDWPMIRRDSAALHEGSHSRSLVDEFRGIHLPYYGNSSALNGFLPASGRNDGYKTYQSFDEMKAYLLSLRLEILDLLKSITAGNTERIEHSMGVIFQLIQQGIIVCKRNIKIANAILDTEWTGLEVDFYQRKDRGEKIYAQVIHGINPHERNDIETIIPLLEANDPDDFVANRVHLRKQLRFMRTAAKLHLGQFELAARVWEKAQGADNYELFGAMMKALRLSLIPLRWQNSPDHIPQYPELIDKFNQRLQAMIEEQK